MHLNYHHLHSFWAVAHGGNLTRVARELRVAPSALSGQIRQLEAQLEEPLFVREGKRLVLTEAGRIVREHADQVFRAGRDLVSTFERGRSRDAVLRVGAVATLSRNFQDSLLAPLLGAPNVHLRLVSGSFEELLSRLGAHALDLVLANQTTATDAAPGSAPFRSRLVARQRVSFVARPRRRRFRFPRDAAAVDFLLPGPGAAIRTAFDALCEKLEVRVKVRAEVDDMAMLRLLARDTDSVAIVPPVVVRDELESRTLIDLGAVPGVREEFYAITVERSHPHPLVRELLAQRVSAILGAP